MTAPRKHGRSWKLLRIYFRRFRIGLWLVLLALLGALLYVNQIGLPDFVKKPLLEKLRARGLDLQFTRLRLRFPYGLVADNVLFGPAGDPASPTFTLKEIQVRLDYGALVKGEFQVNSLLLRQGRLVWPVAETNQPARVLTVENIQTELRFLRGDLWQLDQFKAEFAGAGIQLAGTVTNASAIREWKIFQSWPAAVAGPSSREVLQKNLRRLADALDRIHFPSAPELKLEIYGDARDLPGFGGRLTLRAAGAETPWGSFDRVDFSARVQPPENQEPSRAEIILRAAGARTPWAMADKLALTLHVLSEAATNFNADLNLTAARVETEWGNGSLAQFTAQWRHSATNAIPLSGHGRLQLETAETPWGNGRGLQLTAALSTPGSNAVQETSSPGWWNSLIPYALELDGQLARLTTPQLEATNLSCVADWQMPGLRIKQLSASLYDGSVQAEAKLDVATRELNFKAASDCNVQNLPALLTTSNRQWLAQVSLEKPPQLNLAGQFVLPPWTNQNARWFGETNLALKLLGQVSVTNLAFRDVPFSSVDLHFSDTNQEWRIPDLRVTRLEGRLESAIEYDERAQDFFARLHSTLDANVARLFLAPDQQGGLNLATFTEPPEISAEVWGRVSEPDRLSVSGQVALTNFTFRGQSARGFQSAIEFTNHVLTLREPRVQRGVAEQISAASVRVDMRAERIFITDCLGTANPFEVASAIGPVAGHWFEPYHFSGTPTSRVNGSIAFDIDDGVDLHFDFEGGPFEWWRFKVPRIAGQVNWVNDSLTLKNIHADFYQGQAQGEAEFRFPKGPGTDLRFDVTVMNADLHLLINDLNPRTNQLAGLLGGHWTVTQGNAPDVDTWQGFGHVSLRDGLIMQIPVFGVLSPALNSLMPGLGGNRLSEGTASFGMTNGLIHSDDVDIRASGMRLQYKGDVDLEGRVHARAEAEFLRDTWVVGKMLSLALWPVSKVFEYKISGTLGDPKMEPLYFVPKLILMPLHPFETMKDLMPKAPDASSTNAPPTELKP